MNNIAKLTLSACFIFACAAIGSAQQSLPYKVGVAVDNITPCTGRFRENNICQSGLPGYVNVDAYDVETSGSAQGAALGVFDHLSVRVLAIADSNNSSNLIVLVSIDVAGFNDTFTADIRNRVRSSGLLPEQILINVTHTHSAPTTRSWCPGTRCRQSGYSPSEGEPNQQYMDGVKQRTVAAIERASNQTNMISASLYFASGMSSIGKYRRNDGFLDANEPYPQRLDVLEAHDEDGKVLASAFFYGCHPVHMMLSKYISADFPGAARDYVETKLRESGSTEAKAIFFQGFGGDVNPLTFFFESDSGTVNGKRVQTGRDLGAAVMQLRPSLAPLSGAPRAKSQKLFLALDPQTRPDWPNDGKRFLPAEVQTFEMVGPNLLTPWTLVASSHEVVSEFASLIRNKWPDPSRVTVVGYSNLIECYLPNERIITAAGYEGRESFTIYGKGAPRWTNYDFLELPTGGSGGNHSLLLNGTEAHAEIPDSPSLDVTGMVTVEAWVKTKSSTAQQGIVERYNSFGLGTNNGGYALRLSGGKVAFYTVKNGYEADGIFGDTTLSPHVWHHVAGVFDGTELRVYLDGRLDGRKQSTLAPVAGTASLKIGARGDDGTFTFDGLIDEARLTAGAVYSDNFTPQRLMTTVPNTRGLWKFTGQIQFDSSVNGNDFTRVGGADFSSDVPLPPWSSPFHSLSLNGSGAYVDVPNSLSLDLTGPLTVEAWIKTTTVGTQQGIVERYNWLEGDNGGYVLRLNNEGKLLFCTVRNKMPHGSDCLNGNSIVTPNEWHHVAGVFDGSQLRVYVDGNLDSSKASTITPAKGTNSLKIGARGDDASFKFIGRIDEVRLTSGSWYTSNFTARAQLNAETGTRGLWKFDDQTVRDSSGAGTDGALMAGATFSSDVPAAVPCLAPPSGLVAWLAGDNNASDISGNGNNGTLEGEVNFAPGEVAQAFSLDGNDAVSLGNTISLSVPNGLTLDAWVNPRNMDENTIAAVVTKWGNAVSLDAYGLFLHKSGGVIKLIGAIGDGATMDQGITGGEIPDDRWSHVAMTYDPTSGFNRLYVNGTEVSSRMRAGGTFGTGAGVYIGKQGQGPARHFSGLIDEAGIFNRALSGNEVQAIFVAGATGKCKP